MKKSHLAVCITVHFSEERIKYLEQISDHFASLADCVSVYIVTNAQEDNGEINALNNALQNKGFKYQFFTPTGLGHPYLLTWSHLDVFRRLSSNESITHFMYAEDDLLVTRQNIDYWNESFGILRPLGLIPSFLRIEKNHSNSCWYSSDIQDQFFFNQLPKVTINPGYCFINLPQPYQGMYFLTRELMLEHLNSRSSNPDSGTWYIRERASQGLTFEKVPTGYTSRNLVGFDLTINKFDPRCFIHHLPDNYANREPPDGRLGTFKIDEVISMNRNAEWLKKYIKKIGRLKGRK